MKIAKNSDAAFKIQHKFASPSGWVQWKGTNVCMDVYCVCGAHLHIDAEFAYHVHCLHCKNTYMINGHVELIKIEERPVSCVIEAKDDSIPIGDTLKDKEN